MLGANILNILQLMQLPFLIWAQLLQAKVDASLYIMYQGILC